MADTIEIRYLRSDQHTINSLTAYQLQTSYTASVLEFGTNQVGDPTYTYRFDVYNRHSGGTEDTIGSNIAATTRSVDGGGYQDNTWVCPTTTLAATDAIKLVAEITIGETVYISRDWITGQVSTWAGASKDELKNVTWTIFRYSARTVSCNTWYGSIVYGGGAGPFNRIENFTYGATAGATTYTKTLSLDSILQQLKTKTLSIDSLILKTYTRNTNIDSLLLSIKSKLLSIDANLFYGKISTTLLDAYLQQLDKTKLTNLDAYLSFFIEKITNIDSYLQKENISPTSIDTFLSKEFQRSLGLDAGIFNLKTNGSQLDSMLQAILELTIGLDSFLQKQFTKSAVLDAIIEALTDRLIALDVLLIKENSKILSIDSLTYFLRSELSSIDSILQKTSNLYTGTDALLTYIAVKTMTVNALLQVVDKTDNIFIDSYLQLLNVLKLISIDSLLTKYSITTNSLDALLIQNDKLVSATLDSYLFFSRANILNLDSILKRINEYNTGIDSILESQFGSLRLHKHKLKYLNN